MRLPGFLMEHRLLRIGAALLVPGLMVLVDGLFIWWSPVHLFGLPELPDLLLASYATWAVLAAFVIGRSRLRAVWTGSRRRSWAPSFCSWYGDFCRVRWPTNPVPGG
ncbi:MAG: hypothetical protein ACREK5_00060 [Gemmatimonadota bacterium]